MQLWHDCHHLERTQLHLRDLLRNEVVGQTLSHTYPVLVVQVGDGHGVVGQATDDRVASALREQQLYARVLVKRRSPGIHI